MNIGDLIAVYHYRQTVCFEKGASMSNQKMSQATTAGQASMLAVKSREYPALVQKIGKTTYRVHVHFSSTNMETMSDKIRRMLRNEVQEM